MTKKVLDSNKLTIEDTRRLVSEADALLRELVTPEGIYASSDGGPQGVYHAWFGRDAAITTHLLLESLAIAADKNTQYLAQSASGALARLATWQGREFNAKNGEEAGKMPHEVRDLSDTDEAVHKLLHAARTNKKPWYVDEARNILINWDSCDSTPLWITAMIRAQDRLDVTSTSEIREHIRAALKWCLTTLEKYNGLIAFTAASEQPDREYSGLTNQSWKDTKDIYQLPDGSLAKHPIKELLINAETWWALTLGVDYFSNDEHFAKTLHEAAASLRGKLNDTKEGFAFNDKNHHPRFAEAIAADGVKLDRLCVDHAVLPWTSVDKNAVIDQEEIDRLVRQVTSGDMLNPALGLRNYALGTTFTRGTAYHGSPHTYWPFMSALAACGLHKHGYGKEARAVSRAMLNAVKIFGSNIEMFVENNEGVQAWQHPMHSDHQSAEQQAWTAAGVYYCGKLLLASAD